MKIKMPFSNVIFINSRASLSKLFILNLESVRVTKYQNISGIGLIIHLEPLTKEAECDRCGQISHQVHQNHRYLVKDLPSSGQALYLEVNRRQLKCKNCGVSSSATTSCLS